MLKDFLALIYPRVCAACGKTLFKNENCICTYCSYHLPKTNFHKQDNNPVEKIFWGRTIIFSGASLYRFGKGEKVQQLIHKLKYKGVKEIGVELGKMYGTELKKSEKFAGVDVIIPVPLHKNKQKRRGYNQSEFFAQGLSESMSVYTDFKTLYRAHESQTQTKKSRFNRWKNVESIFQLNNPDSLKNKHVLLVDDVITTGATLEACAQTLLQVPDVKVSVATIAYANH